MKKISMIFFYIFMILIPLYFIVVWNPNIETLDKNINKSMETMSIYYQDSENKTMFSDENKIVLKMSIREIMNSIDKNSKARLKKILYKLSINDYEYICSLMKSEDKDNATKEFVKLVKKRVSVEDYNDFKTILDPYINFKSIY